MKVAPMNIVLGKIAHVELSPMTDGLLSIITITVYVNEITSLIDVHERGTMEGLKEKFGFETDDKHYYLESMEGRMCRIAIDRIGFYFLSYIP